MKRRSSTGIIEKAHLRSNQELYGEGWERIFGRKDKSLHAETSCQEEESSERQVSEFQVSEESSTIQE